MKIPRTPYAKDTKGRRRAAFHEAGHAVANVILGLPFEAVSIREKRDQGTMLKNGQEVSVELIYTEGLIWSPQWTDSVNKELEAGKLDLREAISAMAGPQAEAMLIGEIDEEVRKAADLDMNGIAACCRIAVSPGVPLDRLPRSVMEDDILQALAKQAKELLREKWTAVEAVANELLKRDYLPYSEAIALMNASARE
jgi:hypothetical protein